MPLASDAGGCWEYVGIWRCRVHGGSALASSGWSQRSLQNVVKFHIIQGAGPPEIPTAPPIGKGDTYSGMPDC